MKPYLLCERYDADLKARILHRDDLITDLNLDYIFNVMANDDSDLYDIVRNVILDSITDIDTLTYRQNVLKDCINNSFLIKRIFNITSNAIEEADYYVQYTKPNYARVITVSARLFNSVGLLDILIKRLEELRYVIASEENEFKSSGMNKLCGQIKTYLTDDFFKNVKQHITDLKSTSDGTKIIIGSRIGNGMKGSGHILRKISKSSQRENLGRHLFKTSEQNVIHLDNTSIINSAKEIEDAGLVHILRLVNHFNEGIMEFFNGLRYESGFYYGCTNLYSVLKSLNAEVSFPVPLRMDKRDLKFEKLYDLSLLLNENIMPVSNDLTAEEKNLFVITGANQGGKSTFLRSIGIAQLLMQCGMFVPALSYSADVCDNIFTHFTREEDMNMNSGKLDEELLRMNNIINKITPDSMLLMNEPFATTTERDGSRIAGDIVTALTELNVKLMFVTHLFEFSELMYEKNLENSVFLRAERKDNGSRSFEIKPGKPLRTSYGEDLFNSIIGRKE